MNNRNKLSYAAGLRWHFLISLLVCLICGLQLLTDSTAIALAQTPNADRRAMEIRHLDYDFTNQLSRYQSRAAWQARAEQLRKQILASAGLLPAPDKQPINPTIFNKIDRGTHTVEKVYFESFPGHYVSGNVYRPKRPNGKVPAVLCPHGHWGYGRLENQELNSGPMRAASFAQQGYVAFTWDMVGYDDSSAISHRFAIGHREGTSREVLWSVNLLGLQLWNSIRSVDFLLTLPEVDPERIGCTGESGGGTQTFLLAAVDERIKVAAPVNMVSAIMQGGSLCENAPNLRIDTNNVEIAALFAPRPMLLVSATGDWTKNMLRVEYPAIREIYRLFGAEDRVQAVQMNAPHNYNQESREAVYGWFAHWLKGRAEMTPIKERGVSAAPLTDLMVFYGRLRPANELNEEQLAEALIDAAKRQLTEAQPNTAAAIENFRAQFGETFKYSLMAAYPRTEEITVLRRENLASPLGQAQTVELTRKAASDSVKLTIYQPATGKATGRTTSLALVIAPPKQPPTELIAALLKANHTVANLEVFTGFADQTEVNKYKFIATYNRMPAANRVQDVLTALAFVQQSLLKEVAGQSAQPQLTVLGVGEAGLWTLLARGLAPHVDRMIVDANQFADGSDEAFLQTLPIPGLRRAGDFATAVTLAPLTPLVVYNTGNKFKATRVAEIYRRLGKAEDFRAHTEQLSAAALVASLAAR